MVVSLASYVDVEGRPRMGRRGDVIDVHDDLVGRFDALQAAAVGDLVAESLVDEASEPEPEPEQVKVKPVRKRAAKSSG